MVFQASESGISCRCDYFRATTRNPKLIAKQAKGFFRDDKVTQTGSLYRYRNSLTHIDTKALYLFNGATEAMGNCIQFSGQPISSLMEETKKSSVPALRSVEIDGWKPTRVDIAIDVFHPEMRPRHFWAALDREDKKTCFRGEPREVKMKDPDKGHTVYMGGVESEKQLRVYDKAAEQGLSGVWTRYEMVFMDKRAVEVWEAIQDVASDADLLTRALPIFATMVDFPTWQLWGSVFHNAETFKWQTVPRNESATWEWLVRQVAPAFRKDYDNTGDWSMLKRFVEHLTNG